MARKLTPAQTRLLKAIVRRYAVENAAELERWGNSLDRVYVGDLFRTSATLFALERAGLVTVTTRTQRFVEHTRPRWGQLRRSYERFSVSHYAMPTAAGREQADKE